MSRRLERDQPLVNRLDAGSIRDESFLVLFFRKQQKESASFWKKKQKLLLLSVG
jgi:hypothetical protein